MIGGDSYDARGASNGAGPTPTVRRRTLITRLGWLHRGWPPSRYTGVILIALLCLPFAHDMQIAFGVGPKGFSDYNTYLQAATAFDQNPTGPIYQTHPRYVYPPFFLTLFRPLVWLSPSIGLVAYEVLKWIALYWSLRLAWRLSAPDGEEAPPIVMLLSLLLVSRYYRNDMQNGNVNLFLVAGALCAATLARRGKQLRAGFIVGLLVCIKIMPVLLLVYFAGKRLWWTLLGAIIAGFAGLLLWPGLCVGWSANLRLLGEWYHHFAGGYVSQGAIWSTGMNQGLVAWLNRLFGDAPALNESVCITLVRLPDPWLAALRVMLIAGVLGVLAWTCRPTRAGLPGRLAWAAEIALVQITMLVLSGFTWKAHFVAMILPYAVLLAYLADARCPRHYRAWVIGFLAASVFLMALSGDLFGPLASDYLVAYGVVLQSGLAAGAALVLVRADLRRAEVPRSQPRRAGSSSL